MVPDVVSVRSSRLLLMLRGLLNYGVFLYEDQATHNKSSQNISIDLESTFIPSSVHLFISHWGEARKRLSPHIIIQKRRHSLRFFPSLRRDLANLSLLSISSPVIPTSERRITLKAQ